MCVSCESPRNGKSQQAVPSPIAYLRDDLAVEREVSTAVGACVDALTVQVLLEDPPHCCKPVLYNNRVRRALEFIPLFFFSYSNFQ